MTEPPSSIASPLSKTTLLALTEAFEASLDAPAWAALGVELDMPELGDAEMRLQQALRFGEDDYGYQVAQFVTFMERENPSALRSLAARPKLRSWLDTHAPAAAQQLGLGLAPMAPPSKSPVASQDMERALADADQLLHMNVAMTAMARVHTALHGYLREICAAASLAVPTEASMGMLFKAIRNEHPKLVALHQQDPQVDAVLGALEGAVTALDALRNNASAAQPNHAVPGEPEAMLMINLVRTLHSYLEARLEAG